MTTRAVVRHVKYWRGAVHRWSTVYQFVGTPSSSLGTAAAELVRVADDKMVWSNAIQGNGGTYECQLYNTAVGGVPIATSVAFDWTTPSSWVASSGSAWVAGSVQAQGDAETALLVEWPAGLSSTGKPVKLRKWYHGVKLVSGGTATQQVAAGDVTALEAGANNLTGCLGGYGLLLGSSTGRLAGSAVVKPFYSNHQMPRGRRRRTTSVGGSSESDLGSFLDGLKAGLALSPDTGE